MIDYERIKSDCFWDFNFTNEEIDALVNSENQIEKRFLFEKILLNSTKVLVGLAIFSRDDLKGMLENYKIPQFNADFALRRKNMAEFYFFDQELLIKELQWNSKII